MALRMALRNCIGLACGCDATGRSYTGRHAGRLPYEKEVRKEKAVRIIMVVSLQKVNGSKLQ
jgi:hypothetical protein